MSKSIKNKDDHDILVELSTNINHVIEKVDKLDDMTDILDKTLSYFQVENAVLKNRVDQIEKNKEIDKKEVCDYSRSEDEKTYLKIKNWVLAGIVITSTTPIIMIFKEIYEKIKAP